MNLKNKPLEQLAKRIDLGIENLLTKLSQQQQEISILSQQNTELKEQSQQTLRQVGQYINELNNLKLELKSASTVKTTHDMEN